VHVHVAATGCGEDERERERERESMQLLTAVLWESPWVAFIILLRILSDPPFEPNTERNVGTVCFGGSHGKAAKTKPETGRTTDIYVNSDVYISL
jgi:hypothetical protein